MFRPAQFLAWLADGKTRTTLPPRVLHETLGAIWNEFERRGPREDVVPHFLRWAEILRQEKEKVMIEAVGRRVREWMNHYATFWNLGVVSFR